LPLRNPAVGRSVLDEELLTKPLGEPLPHAPPTLARRKTRMRVPSTLVAGVSCVAVGRIRHGDAEVPTAPRLLIGALPKSTTRDVSAGLLRAVPGIYSQARPSGFEDPYSNAEETRGGQDEKAWPPGQEKVGHQSNEAFRVRGKSNS
jgi:hypothetical protein